jgi:hypothetical protein
VDENVVDCDTILDFKKWASKPSLSDSSHPLFLALSHEADKIPSRNFTQQLVKNLNQNFTNLTFQLNNADTITIQDRVNGLKLSLDKAERVTYDGNRRGLRAKDDLILDRISRKVHACVQAKLPKLYKCDLRYHAFQKYDKKVASALLTLKGARRQPIHCDTSEVEGISALVAMNGPFKFIFFENSVQLIRRIAQIRAQWLNSGRSVPEDIKNKDPSEVEKWFDDAVYAQLVREGWGSSNQLKARKIIVREGAALVFSTWLMHSGHEYSDEDIQLFNRLHLYLLPYDMGSSYDTISMHRTMVDTDGLSFSAALHFIPRQSRPLAPVLLPYLFEGI